MATIWWVAAGIAAVFRTTDYRPRPMNARFHGSRVLRNVSLARLLLVMVSAGIGMTLMIVAASVLQFEQTLPIITKLHYDNSRRVFWKPNRTLMVRAIHMCDQRVLEEFSIGQDHHAAPSALAMGYGWTATGRMMSLASVRSLPEWARESAARVGWPGQFASSTDLILIGCGWPRPIVFAAQVGTLHRDNNFHVMHIGYHHIPVIAIGKVHISRLPTLVLWRGVAISVLFWSVIAGAIRLAVPQCIDWIRNRNPSICACGYPLIGLSQPKCPECGRVKFYGREIRSKVGAPGSFRD